MEVVVFDTGQQVVCVSEDWLLWIRQEPEVWTRFKPYVHAFPIKGCVYTVRSIFAKREWTWLRLQEIINPPCQSAIDGQELGFLSDSFRPVRKTSIDVFRKMLVKPPGQFVN